MASKQEFWRYLTLKFALAPTSTPDASQWNIGGVGSSGVGHVYFMYISCIFHLVCASFSALATRKLSEAKAVFSGIWALDDSVNQMAELTIISMPAG